MSDNNKNSHRTALITGGTRGIGKALVYAFACAGYKVAFCYKKSDKLASGIINDLQSKGYFVVGFKCDVSKFNEVQELYKNTLSTVGHIDTIVNNAGISHKKLFSDCNSKDLKIVLDNNFVSVFNVTNVFVNDLIKNEFGRIINISSIFGNTGASCESLYSASKGAIDSFTKSLAKELSHSNITVNAVAPGLIDTDMNKNLSQDEIDEFLKSTGQKRVGTPKDVAELVLSLANESAGSITGEILTTYN